MEKLFKNPNDINEFASKIGATYYIDPETGYKVLTSHYLKLLGSCCGLGCRHCVYDPIHTKDSVVIKNIISEFSSSI